MSLPVDPRRLRERFPDLTDADVAAYSELTRRILLDPASRARVVSAAMALARQAREKQASGAALEREEQLAVDYLAALEKMQRR